MVSIKERAAACMRYNFKAGLPPKEFYDDLVGQPILRQEITIYGMAYRIYMHKKIERDISSFFLKVFINFSSETKQVSKETA